MTRHSRLPGGPLDWERRMLVAGAVLVCYYLVPLVFLVAATAPDGVLALLRGPAIRSAALTSLLTATMSTLVAITGGLPLAYWLARTDSRWRSIVLAIVTLPLVLPPTVGGVLLLTVVGPQTTIGRLTATVGIETTNSVLGIVLAQTFVSSPLMVVTAVAAFERIDDTLESASRSLGQPPAATFRNVTLPLSRSGLLAGAVLTFSRAIGEFGATVMVAYHPHTLPVELYRSLQTVGLDRTFALALLLVGLGLVVLGVLVALRSNSYQ